MADRESRREERLLRVNVAARRLELSRRQVYRLIEAGELPAVRLSPRGLRIPEGALEKYLQRLNEA